MTKKENKKKPAKQPGKSNKPIWGGLIISFTLVLTFIAFFPSLKNEFTNWDDPTYVTENPLVVNSKVPVKEIFTTPVSLNYHPITILTLAWNYQSGKLDPKGYHMENVIFHLLNTLLVFIFIYLLTKRNLLIAGIVSALFGLHPMHVESVAWVSERKDVLYVFFFLSGLITYLHYTETKKMTWYIVTLILFILSCLSKGMAVVFPVILLLIDYFQARDFRLRTQNFLNKIPFFILSLIFGITAFRIQSGEAIADMQVFSLFQRLMFASYGAMMYVVRFFVPYQLSTLYPYPVTDKNGAIPLIFYLSPFILLTGVTIIALLLRKEKPVVFGLLFYFVSVALVLQFVSVGSAILADRYSYLSYIGLAFAFAWLVNAAWEERNATLAAFKYPLLIITVTGIALFSFQTYARTQVWKSTETLWTDVITNYPTAETAWKNRGNYYGQHNQVEKAMHDYQVLVRMHSKDSKVYSNLGNVYGLRGQGDSALWAYSKAIEMDAKNSDAYVNRAITYCMAKQYDKALPDFEKALSIDPNLYAVYSNRAYAYLASQRYSECVNDYNQYLRFKPEDASAYYFRGLANKALGNESAYNVDIQQAKTLGYKIPGQ